MTAFTFCCKNRHNDDKERIMDDPKDIWAALIRGLNGNTEAILLVGLVFGAGFLKFAGVNEWLACGFPAALYVAYKGRAWASERHKERMLILQIEKTRTEMEPRNQMHQQKLERRKAERLTAKNREP
jgi:hypothetical protein